LLSGLYALGCAALGALPDSRYFGACLIGTSTLYLLIGPVNISALLDFAEVRGRRYRILVAPNVALAAVQIAQAWAGHWVIAGFHPSAWGNVDELTAERLPLAINRASSLLAAATGFGALFHAWRSSGSRRYRLIVVRVLVIAALVNIWGLFASGVVWMRWGYPDPIGLGVGIGLLGYSLLIDRYKHLSERQPDIALSSSPLADPSVASLFVDAGGRISMASEEAARLLGEGLEGEAATKALSGWPSLGEQWEAMRVDKKPREDLPGAIGGGSFALSIQPHRNPFDEFDGAVLRIVPEEKLDELGTRFGLSAREREVARLLCKGYNTNEIAEALFISTATVKSHLHNLYAKTGASGKADLIRAILSKTPDRD
jgi:DNA-binding CsgD family transcriptional regulator